MTFLFDILDWVRMPPVRSRVSSSVSEDNRVVTEVTLLIHNLQVDDNLQLQCLAKNPVGITKETAQLRVYCKYLSLP